jgi:hypothetical protein
MGRAFLTFPKAPDSLSEKKQPIRYNRNTDENNNIDGLWWICDILFL